MYPQALSKQVEQQKKDAQRKFTSWVFNKFKKNKTQFLRDQDERAAETERLRKQKTAAIMISPSGPTAVTSNNDVKQGSSVVLPPSETPVMLQRQQSFLRAQLLEMKRQSQENMIRKRASGEISDAAVSRESRTNIPTSNQDDADDDEDDEYSDAEVTETDVEDSNTGSTAVADNKATDADPAAVTSSHRRRASSKHLKTDKAAEEDVRDEDEEKDTVSRDSERSCISDELERRMTHATLLYEEAISALEEVLHPETYQPRPSQIVTRTRRAESTSKKIFARPDSEWI